jgi:hypothetical protein
MSVEPKMKVCNWVQVSGHWECEVFLDTVLDSSIINAVDNSIWSAETFLPHFIFRGRQCYSCSSPTTEKMLFRINYLQNNHFLSLFF